MGWRGGGEVEEWGVERHEMSYRKKKKNSSWLPSIFIGQATIGPNPPAYNGWAGSHSVDEVLPAESRLA